MSDIIKSLDNPLSLEEKLSVNRVITHDLINEIDTTYWQSSPLKDFDNLKKEDVVTIHNAIMHTRKHFLEILPAILYLTKYDKYNPREKQVSDIKNQLDAIKFILGRNEKIPKKNITHSINTNNKFYTNTTLIYTALFNLAENAYEQVSDLKENGKVSITAEKFSGNVPNIVVESEEMAKKGEFIKFNVNDNGKGFPKNKPLSEYFKLGVTTRRDGGFGLYLVSLIAKFLRCHISVDSKKGNTNVALYNPISYTNDNIIIKPNSL